MSMATHLWKIDTLRGYNVAEKHPEPGKPFRLQVKVNILFLRRPLPFPLFLNSILAHGSPLPMATCPESQFN